MKLLRAGLNTLGLAFLAFVASCAVDATSPDASALRPSFLVDLSHPSTREACRDDGWKTLFRINGTTFKNQGDCIQYVNTGR